MEYIMHGSDIIHIAGDVWMCAASVLKRIDWVSSSGAAAPSSPISENRDGRTRHKADTRSRPLRIDNQARAASNLSEVWPVLAIPSICVISRRPVIHSVQLFIGLQSFPMKTSDNKFPVWFAAVQWRGGLQCTALFIAITAILQKQWWHIAL